MSRLGWPIVVIALVLATATGAGAQSVNDQARPAEMIERLARRLGTNQQELVDALHPLRNLERLAAEKDVSPEELRVILRSLIGDGAPSQTIAGQRRFAFQPLEHQGQSQRELRQQAEAVRPVRGRRLTPAEQRQLAQVHPHGRGEPIQHVRRRMAATPWRQASLQQLRLRRTLGWQQRRLSGPWRLQLRDMARSRIVPHMRQHFDRHFPMMAPMAPPLNGVRSLSAQRQWNRRALAQLHRTGAQRQEHGEVVRQRRTDDNQMIRDHNQRSTDDVIEAPTVESSTAESLE